MKYFDAFGEGGFHTAFMTTYAFGSLAFEDIPLPKLRGAGCRNIVVLADSKMVNQAFSEYGPPRFAGTNYHLIKINSPGAFHPKIVLQIGESKGRLMVGSANLTALGLGGNKEQVASILYSMEEPNNIQYFNDALLYFQSYVPKSDPWFAASLSRAMQSTPWLRNYNIPSFFSSSGMEELNLLLDRPEINFLNQIIKCIGDDSIERLVVLSPYWDSRLIGLEKLKLGLGNPSIDILISSDINGFPSRELERISDIKLFDIKSRSSERFVHAKLIIAQGRDWDHVISGSMNCTLPALMGGADSGNAEAGIYKRVMRGTALAALELNNYHSTPILHEKLVELQNFFIEDKKTNTAIDGGILTLQSGIITWRAPEKIHAATVLIRLYDRYDDELAHIETNGLSYLTYTLEAEEGRPIYGALEFVGGLKSAPIQIIDLGALSIKTLSFYNDKRKRLIDAFDEYFNEDLMIIETLNELEALEDQDKNAHSLLTHSAKNIDHENIIHEYKVLSYEEFIKARTLANTQGKMIPLYLGSRHDRAVNLVSICFNRMIGLVDVDLDDEVFREYSEADYRKTEPDPDEDSQSSSNAPLSTPVLHQMPSKNLPTAMKFHALISAFEKRNKALQGKKILTSEMVRLRCLIQLILSHGQPVTGNCAPSQILPVYSLNGYDWPRLIGRLLRQHFGSTIALQNLSVEPEESEQHRVLEYLALSNWAAEAAYSAILPVKEAEFLKCLIEKLMISIKSQTQVILDLNKFDKSYFDMISSKLDQKFEKRLGIVRS